MKLTFSHLLFLLPLFCNVGLKGQNTPACTYKLECADLGLDGWNDASLEIIVGNKVNRFTLQTGRYQCKSTESTLQSTVSECLEY